MTDEFWSADRWFDPLATSDELNRMSSPPWWLDDMNGGL